MWIDVEDSAALVDRVDVENFPTILIGQGEHPRFFGVITPQPEVLLRLIAAHLRGGSEDARNQGRGRRPAEEAAERGDKVDSPGTRAPSFPASPPARGTNPTVEMLPVS